MALAVTFVTHNLVIVSAFPSMTVPMPDSRGLRLVS
jgi:hypothetical protein